MRVQPDKSNPPAPARIASEGPRTLRAGFIPLVDASVLIAAAEFGFARKEGIALDLVKDVSWANVRDRLAFRQFDIAHMLSPMPVAAMLGLGSNPSPTVTPFSLGCGGNAITLSTRLFDRMCSEAGLSDHAGALENSQALAKVVRTMKARGELHEVRILLHERFGVEDDGLLEVLVRDFAGERSAQLVLDLRARQAEVQSQDREVDALARLPRQCGRCKERRR